MKYLQSLKNSVWRIILVIAGLLHILIFFVLPYVSYSGELQSAAEAFGQITSFTGYTFIVRMFAEDAAVGIIMIVLAALPIIFGIVMSLVSFFSAKKKNYITAIVMSALQLPFYAIFCMLMAYISGDGWNFNILAPIIVSLLPIFQIVIAAVGLKKKDWKLKPEPKPVPHVMNGTIKGLSGAYLNAVLPVVSGNNIVIGRNPDESNVVIKGENVSRKHCEIAYDKETGMYIVTDRSTNGTFDATGARLPLNRPVRMRPGSTIRISENGDEFRLG